MAKQLKRILVANRGEIACRIIQSIQEMGKEAVAVFSDADKDLRHVELANTSEALAGNSATESYLHIGKLIAAAKKHACDGIHPGYGFISERANAAEDFLKAGITWIGPSPQNIRELGDKLGAKKVLEKYKVPTLPWAEVEISKPDSLKNSAKKIGYPLLLKAASGGGGKGMRLVKSESELLDLAQITSKEASASFGDGTLLLEKYLANPRHIEVQMMGDRDGNVMTFGERECSAQRRHQKVIEEAPAANLSKEARARICEAARSLGSSMKYQNAGTVEFLVDDKEDFYFLEVNSRLQVEHPVTELVWGVDLVKTQILVAEGNSLAKIFPETPIPRGHAIEARLYAEDPANGFAPSPGILAHVKFPPGKGIRIESGVQSGDEITLNYDAMIAKIIGHGHDREEARKNLLWALRHSEVFGVVTNINYLQDILEDPTFINAKMHVKYLETNFANWKNELPEDLIKLKDKLLASATVGLDKARQGSSGKIPSPWGAP